MIIRRRVRVEIEQTTLHSSSVQILPAPPGPAIDSEQAQSPIQPEPNLPTPSQETRS